MTTERQSGSTTQQSSGTSEKLREMGGGYNQSDQSDFSNDLIHAFQNTDKGSIELADGWHSVSNPTVQGQSLKYNNEFGSIVYTSIRKIISYSTDSSDKGNPTPSS